MASVTKKKKVVKKKKVTKNLDKPKFLACVKFANKLNARLYTIIQPGV